MSISIGNSSVSKIYVGNAEVSKIYVGADLVYQSGPAVDPVLANNSWATIRQVCEAGQASNYWALGDTKTDTGTDTAVRTMRICDMQGLYGKHVVFEQVELETTDYQWNPDTNIDSDNCYNNYSISNMRVTHLPAILAKYSSELQSFITNTTYKVATNGNNGTLLELTDKLFLPAEKELYGSSANYCRSEEAAALTQFQYYATHSTNADHIKYKPGQTSGYYWWQRSPYSGYANGVCVCGSDGSGRGNGADDSNAVAPCFSF